MKKLIMMAALILGLAVIQTGCGPDSSTPEGIMEQMLPLMEKAVGVIDGITDEASAKAAKAKLEEIDKQGKELTAKMNKLMEGMSKEEKKAKSDELKAKFKPQIDAMTEKMVKVMKKLMANPKLMQVIGNDIPRF